MSDKETYIGDAVYVSFAGGQIKLRTDDYRNQVIYLEPATYFALERFVRGLENRNYATSNIPLSVDADSAARDASANGK